jgi:Uma2 family endonuclease
MPTPAQKQATYDDILALPEHVTGEIIAGELLTQPRPASPHSFVASGLGGELLMRFGQGGGGGWTLLHEPELHLEADVLVPDITGWRSGCLPGEARRGAFIEIAPDWVCEVASPSTKNRDRLIKVPAYARHGVDYLWLVEPVECRLEAYERSGERWLLIGTWAEHRDARVPPFDSQPIDLIRLWDSTGR